MKGVWLSLLFVVACQPGELRRGYPKVDEEGLELFARLIDSMSYEAACSQLEKSCTDGAPVDSRRLQAAMLARVRLHRSGKCDFLAMR